jgi:hypothetical protein
MERNQVMAQLEPLTRIGTITTDRFESIVAGNHGEQVLVRGGEFGGIGMPLTFDARKKLFSLAGLRRPTVEKLSPSTASRVLTELTTEQPQLFIHDDTMVIDIRPPQELRPVSITQVADILEETIGEHDFHRVLTYGSDVHIESIGRDMVPDVVGTKEKNSLVQAGVVTKFSPVGFSLPQVQSFVVRLVCTNGMVGTEVLETYQAEDMNNFGSWYSTSISDAYDSVGSLVHKWQLLAEEGISAKDRMLMLTALLRDAKMPAKAREAVHAQALENPPQTSYDVLQLMTWATSHVLENPRHIFRAQNVATRFVNEEAHIRLCPTCDRVA